MVRKDVILVVDVSGSMQSVLGQVQQTVLQLGLNLHPLDRLAIVTFGSQGSLLLPLSPVPPRIEFEDLRPRF